MSVNWKNRSTIWVPVLVALVPASFLAYHLGAPLVWPALLMPASVLVFTALWARRLTRAISRLGAVIAVVLWAIGVHVAVWLPFILVAWLRGNGLENFIYTAAGTLVSASVVAWYILTGSLWPTLTMGILLATFTIAVFRRAS